MTIYPLAQNDHTQQIFQPVQAPCLLVNIGPGNLVCGNNPGIDPSSYGFALAAGGQMTWAGGELFAFASGDDVTYSVLQNSSGAPLPVLSSGSIATDISNTGIKNVNLPVGLVTRVLVADPSGYLMNATDVSSYQTVVVALQNNTGVTSDDSVTIIVRQYAPPAVVPGLAVQISEQDYTIARPGYGFGGPGGGVPAEIFIPVIGAYMDIFVQEGTATTLNGWLFSVTGFHTPRAERTIQPVINYSEGTTANRFQLRQDGSKRDLCEWIWTNITSGDNNSYTQRMPHKSGPAKFYARNNSANAGNMIMTLNVYDILSSGYLILAALSLGAVLASGAYVEQDVYLPEQPVFVNYLQTAGGTAQANIVGGLQMIA